MERIKIFLKNAGLIICAFAAGGLISFVLTSEHYEKVMNSESIIYDIKSIDDAAVTRVMPVESETAAQPEASEPEPASETVTASEPETESETVTADEIEEEPTEAEPLLPEPEPEAEENAQIEAEETSQIEAEPIAETAEEKASEPEPEVREIAATELEAAAEAPPAEEKKATTAPASGTVHTYVLNTNSKKFHYDTCTSVGKMKESNKDYFTGTREEVIAQGYEPCKNCNP